MYHISAIQIKAARAMLDWLQDDLAAACGLSKTTVRSLEAGNVSLRSLKEVQKAFENAGLEFLEGDGVKRRDDQIIIYRGTDSCDRFFADMLQTIKEKGGDVVCALLSADLMTQNCGAHNNLERMEQINEIADIKCLISDASMPNLSIPTFEFRTVSKQLIGPISYYVYGNKYAHVLQQGRGSLTFVAFNTPFTAQDYQRHFLSLWENALPLKPFSGLQQHPKLSIKA